MKLFVLIASLGLVAGEFEDDVRRSVSEYQTLLTGYSTELGKSVEELLTHAASISHNDLREIWKGNAKEFEIPGGGGGGREVESSVNQEALFRELMTIAGEITQNGDDAVEQHKKLDGVRQKIMANHKRQFFADLASFDSHDIPKFLVTKRVTFDVILDLALWDSSQIFQEHLRSELLSHQSPCSATRNLRRQLRGSCTVKATHKSSIMIATVMLGLIAMAAVAVIGMICLARYWRRENNLGRVAEAGDQQESKGDAEVPFGEASGQKERREVVEDLRVRPNDHDEDKGDGGDL
eukprot:GEMP01017834.1.p1 GENE.GEMP01017834.1~~GEMP01017834.1.p1  ORF type:complete len:294 (-),score=55.53 GEMP01017834.1:521-1402(-)